MVLATEIQCKCDPLNLDGDFLSFVLTRFTRIFWGTPTANFHAGTTNTKAIEKENASSPRVKPKAGKTVIYKNFFFFMHRQSCLYQNWVLIMNTKNTDSIPAQNRLVQGLEDFSRSCRQERNLNCVHHKYMRQICWNWSSLKKIGCDPAGLGSKY